MSCEELEDVRELFVLGVLDEPEKGELRSHLSRGCATCTPDVSRARDLVSALASLAPVVQPRAALRRRVLGSVGVPSRRWAPLWIAVSACLLAGLLAIGLESHRRGQELDQQARRTLQLESALALAAEPGTIERTFGTGAPRPPRGNVFVHPSRGVLLLSSNLPPAPAGKIYEMWVIPKTGDPAPAGLFRSDETGRALHMLAGPIDIAGIKAIAVTLEAEGGSSRPTSEPLIVAAL